MAGRYGEEIVRLALAVLRNMVGYLQIGRLIRLLGDEINLFPIQLANADSVSAPSQLKIDQVLQTGTVVPPTPGDLRMDESQVNRVILG